MTNSMNRSVNHSRLAQWGNGRDGKGMEWRCLVAESIHRLGSNARAFSGAASDGPAMDGASPCR